MMIIRRSQAQRGLGNISIDCPHETTIIVTQKLDRSLGGRWEGKIHDSPGWSTPMGAWPDLGLCWSLLASLWQRTYDQRHSMDVLQIMKNIASHWPTETIE